MPSLPEMNGDAFKIHLKPDAQPYAQAKARRIPIPYMDQLKKQLDEMERLGVISSHKEPSTWCHPIVIAPKKDSDELRICIDFNLPTSTSLFSVNSTPVIHPLKL